MTDYVSVDPDRLRDLAYALRDAAKKVRDEAPNIVDRIDGWGATFSAAKLNDLADWLDDQWKPMLDRADLAATYSHDPVFSSPDDPNAHWRSVPWEIDDAVLAEEGRKDALNLAADANSDDEQVRERARQEAAEAMEAHADDPAYLEAFYGNGGAQIIDTMNTQIVDGGVPLSDQAQQQLDCFARGVAAVTSYSESEEISLGDNAMDPLLGTENTLTTGLMMKYGPAGDTYGSAFLSTAADDALAWREQNQPARPHHSEPMTTSAGYVPGGWVQDDGDWWTELGINVSYLDTNAEEAAEGIDQMRQYDPAAAILTRTGENADASRDLVTGDGGLENAKALVDFDWQTPGSTVRDDSGPAATVILAATMDRENYPEQSAQAAANVFEAGYEVGNRERSDYDREQYPQAPPALAQALSAVASNYATDMARSTSEPDVNVHSALENGDLQTNTEIMNGYMSFFMTDPNAAGTFRGAVQSQLSTSAEKLTSGDGDPGDLLRQFGRLNGMVSITYADQKFDEAERQDAANAQAQAYLGAASGITLFIPKGGKLVEFIWGSAYMIGNADLEPFLPTDNAAQVEQDTQYTMRTDIADMRTHVAQGFMNSGAYVPPDDAPFVHDGVISPRNDEEQAAFNNWWSRLPADPLADIAAEAPDGFLEATTQFAPNDDRFNNPK